MSKGELLPCPFCGCPTTTIWPDLSEDEPQRVIAYHVSCDACGARGPNSHRIGWLETESAAEEAWGNRSDRAGLIAGLREGLDTIKKVETQLLHDGYGDGPGGGNYLYVDVIKLGEVIYAILARIAALEEEGEKK